MELHCQENARPRRKSRKIGNQNCQNPLGAKNNSTTTQQINTRKFRKGHQKESIFIVLRCSSNSFRCVELCITSYKRKSSSIHALYYAILYYAMLHYALAPPPLLSREWSWTGGRWECCSLSRRQSVPESLCDQW
mmetsp:Transcript_21036/g.44132  ORF Transcript_21036/g.44132 Transcript_21036/m.44132 type:complete len:135 (+) Transcript_21036:177-581(+)